MKAKSRIGLDKQSTSNDLIIHIKKYVQAVSEEGWLGKNTIKIKIQAHRLSFDNTNNNTQYLGNIKA
ncbi:hypothetical protein VSA01S_31720 [Vibrio sagamiensis NBRC 104589]|uniref:Uncharacterized protein n=1 Tax=Vibrio sagamiensis NBRC 104589 TaxID=1219064 RepID=A0A511QIB7_9VIBR|nr:hypothetical protein VSA01S_31720 [Vibrio sagamiensis NBRC 104589]